MEEQTQGQHTSGQNQLLQSDDKKIAWVAYLFGWITGLVLFFVKKDEYVRFHAMQSIILFGGLHILQIFLMPFFGFGMMRNFGSVNSMMGTAFAFSGIYTLVQIALFVLWIVLMVKAHKGEKYKLPLIGDLAEKWAK